jgi:hypothetical protein
MAGRNWGAWVVAAAAVIAGPAVALSCPFCAAPERTLTEQLGEAAAAVLVQWASGTPANREKETLGETNYRVVEVLRDGGEKIEKGSTIRLDRFRPGKSGDLFLLMGSKLDEIAWGSPMEVSETSYNYIKQAPGKEAPAVQRLAYFLKFLEYPDMLVANDAYSEFAGAPYADLVPLASKFNPEKVRSWIASPNTVPTRLGFYGLVLGLCGKAEDIEFLKSEILKPVEGYRLGVDGMMSGYLLLTGDDGVTLLEEKKLKDTSAPFSETYAAMQALRFMWQYGEDHVSKDRLREAMRVLLDRPEVADLVITDLTRWEDWGVMDRLMSMYDAPDFNNNQTRRAVVRYLLAMSKKKAKADDDAAVSDKLAKNVAKAKANLDLLRKKDPDTVKHAEKFFFTSGYSGRRPARSAVTYNAQPVE